MQRKRAGSVVTLIMAVVATSLAGTAQAATFEVKDQKAQDILTVLASAGMTPKSVGKGFFKIALTNLRCESRNRGAYDPSMPDAGVPVTSCTMGSSNQHFSEGIALVDAIDAALTGIEGAYFMDCAMGRCAGVLDKLTCQINTHADSFGIGRFRCWIKPTE